MNLVFFFFWVVVGILLLQMTLVLWLCWPTVWSKLHCVWCWRSVHLAALYPEAWSSTICAAHYRQVLTQSAARRLRRMASQLVPQQEGLQ